MVARDLLLQGRPHRRAYQPKSGATRDGVDLRILPLGSLPFANPRLPLSTPSLPAGLPDWTAVPARPGAGAAAFPAPIGCSLTAGPGRDGRAATTAGKVLAERRRGF